MKISDFVTTIKSKNPKVFAKLNDAQIRQIANSVLQEVALMIEQATENEIVAVPNLGRVKVKMVSTKEDPSTKIRRAILLPAKALPKN